MQSIDALHYAGARWSGCVSNRFERRRLLARHLSSRFKRVRRFVRAQLATFIDLFRLHARMPIPVLVLITRRRNSGRSSGGAIDLTGSGPSLNAGSGASRAAQAVSADGDA